MAKRPDENPPAPEHQNLPPDTLMVKIGELREKLKDAVDPSLEDIRTRLDAIYERLPELAPKILDIYKAVCAKNGFKPGRVQLWMIGGRVQGKPLKADSDIDLVFAMERRDLGPAAMVVRHLKDVEDGEDCKTQTRKEIVTGVKELCRESQVPNEFHILEYGSAFLNPAPDRLLLAEA